MKNYKAFTLIELIVVITILAILGTIAFFSYNSYSKSSRDSVRVSDLAKIKSALGLYEIDAGKYPTPNNPTNITYEGGTIWAQGSFGKSTFTNTDLLDKIPKDPLVDKEYTYSVTDSKNQYQLGSVHENYNIASITNNSYAGDISIYAYITGNYNGLAARSINGNNCYVLNVPSIITNDLDNSTDYQNIINDKKLVFNGYTNIPSTYKNSKFKHDGGFDYTPNNLIIYNDNDSCKNLENNNIVRINHLKEIQNSYSGTILKNIDSYSSFLDLEIKSDTFDNNSLNVKGTSGNIWLAVLGKKIKNSYSNNSSGSGTTTISTPEEPIIEGEVDLNVGDKIVCPLCGS